MVFFWLAFHFTIFSNNCQSVEICEHFIADLYNLLGYTVNSKFNKSDHRLNGSWAYLFKLVYLIEPK